MIAAVQEMIGDQDFRELKPCLLPNDVATAKIRRRMDELLRSEGAPAEV